MAPSCSGHSLHALLLLVLVSRGEEPRLAQEHRGGGGSRIGGIRGRGQLRGRRGRLLVEVWGSHDKGRWLPGIGWCRLRGAVPLPLLLLWRHPLLVWG